MATSRTTFQEALFTPDRPRLRRRFGEERAHLLQLSEGSDGPGSLLSNVLPGQPDRGVGAPERRHAPDLGLGRDLGRAHPLTGSWRFSYLAVLVVMVLICVVLYRGFRRSGWL